jgi:hypothetical protein
MGVHTILVFIAWDMMEGHSYPQDNIVNGLTIDEAVYIICGTHRVCRELF